MAYCDRCGVEDELEPLEGTDPPRAFCSRCASVVRALGLALSKCGAGLGEILWHISLRFSRPTVEK